ncbi:MAG: thioredoxin domain-containing protein [Anaerolineales bacterium]
MLERALGAILLIALGVLLYWGWQRWQLRRAATSGLAGLEARQPGVAAILYFTTPTCVPCRTVQRPALASLAETFGERLQIITIDATERPDVADHWGVLTIPTTFVFDPSGTPLACNMGVANAAKLLGQLEAAGLERPQTQPVATRPVLEK